MRVYVMAEQSTSLDWDKVKSFAGIMTNELGAALMGALSYIGDRLEIFQALANSGPVTSAELAAKTGLNERYLREWLGAMTAAKYLEYDPASGRYSMPREHAMVLADESSPFYMGGFIQMVVPEVAMAPKLIESFRTGRGIPQSEYPPEVFEAIERSSAPMYRHSLLRKWLPAMPQVIECLNNGGEVLDVGCGSGRAAITIASAFPKARVHGYDAHAGSIERARANAKAAGVDDRVSFDVVHDSVDPGGLLKSIHDALKPDGTCLMVEVNASARVEDNINPLGRMMYAASTLYCMTVSLAHQGAGLGALMGEAKALELAQKAGFSRSRRLPVKDAFSALYELRP